MSLTQKQRDELESLEAIPEGLGLNVYMPNLDDDSIWRLGAWAQKAIEHAPQFGNWLHSLVIQEIYRRGTEEPTEVQVPRVPIDWNNTEVGKALQTCFSMARSNQLRSLDDFIWSLCEVLSVIAASRLEKANR